MIETPASRATGQVPARDLPDPGGAKPRWGLWFALTLALAAVYGMMALRLAFHETYGIADDARQHVFWMARFRDASLFPGDLMADYFQSVAPAGYRGLYWALARAGLDPLLANRLLPPLLGLIAAGYCFQVFRRILASPVAAFTAAILLCQMLWTTDDLLSGTPRAFVYPLFLAFLHYLLEGALLPCLAALVLEGLFYPQAVFVSVGVLVLRLVRWERRLPRLSRERGDYLFAGAGLVTAALVLLPFALATSKYGPVITRAEALQLPQFWEEGRSQFFAKNPFDFWLKGDRSGLMPRGLHSPLMLCGLLLPVLLLCRARFPLLRLLGRGAALLPQITTTSVLLFLAAHALLFRLHLPSRYGRWSFRIILAFAAALVLAALWDALLRWARVAGGRGAKPRLALARAAAGLTGVLLLGFPFAVKQFPDDSYKIGRDPELYRFFAAQPKDTLIASVSPRAELIPAFARRPLLVSSELAIPYHLGYYRPVRDRGVALFRAQYSPDPREIRSLIERYGVDYWVVDRYSFGPGYLDRRHWFRQIDPAFWEETWERLDGGESPALERLMGRAIVFSGESYVVLGCDRLLAAARAAEREQAPESVRLAGQPPGARGGRPH